MFKIKITLRYIIFMLGLFATGLGIALSSQMGLGTTPISVIPLVVSAKYHLTFGLVANILSLTFIALEILIQGKGFNKELFKQILVAPFFGFFIDIGFKIFKNLNPSLFEEKIIYLLFGCGMMALGIYLQISAKVVVNPCDGLVKVIAEKTKQKFSSVKIYVDVAIMAIGIIISLMVFGRIYGVGLATVLLALLTGAFIKLFKNLFSKVNVSWLFE